MAGNHERNNPYFDERSMPPSRQHQYSPSYNIDNNNGQFRPPPGLSPVPHFMPHIQGSPLCNQQQFSYPMMPKNNNANTFYNMAPPPPGYAFFTPPHSPHFMNTQSHLPSMGSFDQQLQQQLHQGYGHPSMYPFPLNDDYENECVVPDYILQDAIKNTAAAQRNRTPTISEASNSSVIEPIIENIVGTSSGGTYTHFGSAHPVARSGFDSNLNGGNLSSLISGNTMQSQRGRMTETKEKNVWKEGLLTMSNENGTDKLQAPPRIDSHAVQRPSTPISPALSAKSKSSGSPVDLPATQSSAKPSYLEILTKSSKNNENGKGMTLKTYANVSEVHSSSRDSPTHQLSSGHPFIQIHNQVHRKLSGSGHNVGDGSNSSTASSSPLVKPKQNQTPGLKGKENNCIQHSNAKGSPAKSNNDNNTPYDTPTKQKRNEWTKKIGNNRRNANGGGSLGKSGGNKTSNYINGLGLHSDGITSITTFDLDIEDLDDGGSDGNENSDDKSGKKKTNSNDSTKEKSKKYNNSVGNGYTNNNINSDRRVSDGKGQSLQFLKRGRDKAEKPRSRKEERNCTIRRLRIASAIWLGHLIAALNWLWTLLLSVTTLSASLGYSLIMDVFIWWKTQAVPKFVANFHLVRIELIKLKTKWKLSRWNFWSKKESNQKKPPETPTDFSELLSVLGPERNITLPANGDEALQRLLSVKGKDPYSILGVRSDSGDETIRRYYKKQAVLVHPDKNLVPGAEEAFKILARAFELVGEPIKRTEYHRQLLEAHAKERFMGEFGNLFEQLRKKMESVCTTIRCTKCNARHKKNRTERPVFAARFCAQCRIHHAAREGELWAEKKGMFGFWQYYACMGNQVWEMNEWGKCQRKSLKHLVPDSHAVIYRLVSGTQTGQQKNNSTNNTNNNGSNSNSSSSNQADDLLDPEMDDWDSLLNNLYRGPSGTTCNGTSSSNSHSKGTGRSSTLNGHNNTSTGSSNLNTNGSYGTSSSTSTKKRKGRRK